MNWFVGRGDLNDRRLRAIGDAALNNDDERLLTSLTTKWLQKAQRQLLDADVRLKIVIHPNARKAPMKTSEDLVAAQLSSIVLQIHRLGAALKRDGDDLFNPNRTQELQQQPQPVQQQSQPTQQRQQRRRSAVHRRVDSDDDDDDHEASIGSDSDDDDNNDAGGDGGAVSDSAVSTARREALLPLFELLDAIVAVEQCDDQEQRRLVLLQKFFVALFEQVSTIFSCLSPLCSNCKHAHNVARRACRTRLHWRCRCFSR